MDLKDSNLIKVNNNGDNRFLVLARVGDNSLHKEWIKQKKYKNFDLFLEYYGDGSNDYRNDFDFYTEGKNTKWPRLYELLKKYRELIFKYDAIWIPDDDIRTNSYNINNMFNIFTKYKLALAQPALNRDSYYSHKITLRKSAYKLRYTRFVEVMVPLFSREALQLCCDSFQKSRSGWGLDSIWPKLLGYPKNKIAIIDETPVTHTRPVGGGTLYSDIECSPYVELERICREYGVTKYFDFNIYGVVPSRSSNR